MWDAESERERMEGFEQSYVAKPKKGGGRYFPFPSCPDGEIDEKDQKTRSVEIVRQREKLKRIINDKKRKRGGK